MVLLFAFLVVVFAFFLAFLVVIAFFLRMAVTGVGVAWKAEQGAVRADGDPGETALADEGGADGTAGHFDLAGRDVALAVYMALFLVVILLFLVMLLLLGFLVVVFAFVVLFLRPLPPRRNSPTR